MDGKENKVDWSRVFGGQKVTGTEKAARVEGGKGQVAGVQRWVRDNNKAIKLVSLCILWAIAAFLPATTLVLLSRMIGLKRTVEQKKTELEKLKAELNVRNLKLASSEINLELSEAWLKKAHAEIAELKAELGKAQARIKISEAMEKQTVGLKDQQHLLDGIQPRSSTQKEETIKVCIVNGTVYKLCRVGLRRTYYEWYCGRWIEVYPSQEIRDAIQASRP